MILIWSGIKKQTRRVHIFQRAQAILAIHRYIKHSSRTACFIGETKPLQSSWYTRQSLPNFCTCVCVCFLVGQIHHVLIVSSSDFKKN